MSIELFNPTSTELQNQHSIEKQQGMLDQSTAYKLQELLQESNPDIKIKHMEAILSKNPGFLTRLIKGEPDPMLREFQRQSYKQQTEHFLELSQLAHKVKINLLEQKANFYIQSLSMYNATALAQIVTRCIDEVRLTIKRSEMKFISEFDNRISEIDNMYKTQQAKDLAYRRLHRQMKTHEEIMDELLKKATDSLQQRLPSNDQNPNYLS